MTKSSRFMGYKHFHAFAPLNRQVFINVFIFRINGRGHSEYLAKRHGKCCRAKSHRNRKKAIRIYLIAIDISSQRHNYKMHLPGPTTLHGLLPTFSSASINLASLLSSPRQRGPQIDADTQSYKMKTLSFVGSKRPF